MTNIGTLPGSLRDYPYFCCWRYEERNGRKTKVPYNPFTGGKAQSSNPDTFAPLPVAAGAMQGYDGLGVGIFDTLGAIDIDHCVKDGALSDMAVDIIDTMNSYTEYSPSGEGIRILFYAPGFQYDTARYYINNQKAGLEVYIAGCTKKYVTVTGNALFPSLALDMEQRKEELAQVLEKYMVRPVQAPAQDRGAPMGWNEPIGGPGTVQQPSPLDDMALLQRAKAAKNGAQFERLYAGDTCGYNSQSEAELALCNQLAFWTGCDPARMDALFRQSGLMRDKWDRRQSGTTYGAMTIQKAIQGCREVYTPGHSSGSQAGQRTDVPPGKNPVQAPASIPEPVRPPDYSDAGNAEVFSRLHRDDLIFTDALGWLWWDGTRWDRSDHKATAFAIDLSARMLKEAKREHREALQQQAEAKGRYAESGEETDKEALEKANAAAAMAKNYLNHAKSTRESRRIKNMIELSKPALVLPTAQLDANPFDLNTPAGIVDLNTGAIRPHDRRAYCTKITKAAPGQQGAQMWSDFLATITQGDVNLELFLQTVCGMALFGKVYHEGIVLAYGSGRNGKSTLFNSVGAAIGDYTGAIAVDVLTVTKNGNQGASLATLRGKRLVITGELEEHQRLSVAMLKRLASTDTLRIEEKYRAPEDITPSHSIVLFTNHLPRVGSTDAGTWRRLVVVPFLAAIPANGGIANYGEVLAQEAGPAILQWCIEGAVLFARNGYHLQVPEAVEEATDEYRNREDWLSNFISERCEKGLNLRVGAAELYSAYRDWAAQSGEYVRRLNDFNTAMEIAGYHKIKPKNKATWEGLQLEMARTGFAQYPQVY